MVEGIGAGTWCSNSFRAGFVPAAAIETAFWNAAIHEMHMPTVGFKES